MIYFIRYGESGPIKIGRTRNIKTRLIALQNNMPELLYLVGVIDDVSGLEYELHEKFIQYNIRGEWFKPVNELLDFVDKNAIPLDFQTVDELRTNRSLSLHVSTQRPRKMEMIYVRMKATDIRQLELMAQRYRRSRTSLIRSILLDWLGEKQQEWTDQLQAIWGTR